MKLTLLTLAALILSIQQASALRGTDSGNELQQDSQGATDIPICKENAPLSFNITEAGQSAKFKCDTGVNHLRPKYNATNPLMYSGETLVPLTDLLPSATFKTAPVAAEKETRTNAELSYTLTVPALPTEKHNLHVICSNKEAAAESQNNQTKECKVTFHIDSSAGRPVLAAVSAVIGLVASLSQLA
ncbi:SAG-related sequence SRS22C [Toxoplasma gondii GAB2-2007-GAL-DOM2]|uniref:SAG-related sequence SRS22C n=8 Tax=Toxoplasma gondii TaxID=5811 RepID=S7URL4_TOXGG|nr:SAG-related sequence SRS22C [Toxoplasma gondii GT1]KAF4643541.1 SAG-related sequence SRS22C [Toxoplasma gondii]KFG29758.1 SAG-related sequence SRS22C [Toxoplasma gondii GAB2-2007-GAL-DOM2]KFG33997.1 SAG-related sequence SRS22C [Toxoplasma gondii FOU]KFG39325.1 SAG-related sequence SRS22C [Toxoplasma gondii p89]KFH02837.1 SAG-related sequence SRS22C [Toxoplasma gondii MAS]PUA87008.1 SAG-related sequence SRS22C [Toxoplasma gondii TgCATBr9]RQX70673.1 SAG-related sequence SRS22C [Toxoplasma g